MKDVKTSDTYNFALIGHSGDGKTSIGEALLHAAEVIQEAAATANVPKERIATHSLRIGGASALLHAGFSVALIQRWGRWASDAFQSYLWESSEDARGVAAKMTSDKSTLTVTR